MTNKYLKLPKRKQKAKIICKIKLVKEICGDSVKKSYSIES